MNYLINQYQFKLSMCSSVCFQQWRWRSAPAASPSRHARGQCAPCRTRASWRCHRRALRRRCPADASRPLCPPATSPARLPRARARALRSPRCLCRRATRPPDRRHPPLMPELQFREEKIVYYYIQISENNVNLQ